MKLGHIGILATLVGVVVVLAYLLYRAMSQSSWRFIPSAARTVDVLTVMLVVSVLALVGLTYLMTKGSGK